MLLLRPCLVLLVLGGAASSALAEDSRLTVGVTDADTGRVLRGAACALVRAGAKRAYARFGSTDDESPDDGLLVYRGRSVVEDGDTLIVYRRGRDLARVILKKGQQGVEVALKPASRQCAIDLSGANKEDVRLRLSWRIVPSGTWIGKKPIKDSFDEDVVKFPVRRSVPAGASVHVTVSAAGRLFWPRTTRLDGEAPRVVLHEEAAWEPVFRIDPEQANRFGPRSILFLPDYGFAPAGPARRVDAWKWQVTRIRWGRNPRPVDGAKLRILPAVPIFAMATVDGVTVARRFGPGDPEVDLRNVEPYRVLKRVPHVGREPAPPGSFVLSGRHDLATVGALLTSRAEFPATVVVLPEGKRGQLPAARDLVPSDWLTVWHPDHGLAHLRWRQEPGGAEPPAADWYPCSMEIRAPRGWLLDGKAVAYPVWRGTGAVRTTPPVEPIQRKFRRVASVRFAGLQPSWHAFAMSLDLVEQGTGRRHRVSVTYTARLDLRKPRRAYRLYSPDRVTPK